MKIPAMYSAWWLATNKSTWWWTASAILLLVLAGWVTERMVFLSAAERTIGVVEKIEGINGRCKIRRGRRQLRKFPCTKFLAGVSFTTAAGSQHLLTLKAGEALGKRQPISRASRRLGERVGVIYDPQNPKKVFRDSVDGVWLGPIFVFLILTLTLALSFLIQKKR